MTTNDTEATPHLARRPVSERWATFRAQHALRRSARPGVAPLAATLVALLVIYGIALFVLHPSSPGRQVDLNRLVTAAQTHDVATAHFQDEDARITGELSNSDGTKTKYWASYPSSGASTNDLLQTLLKGNAAVTVDPQSFKTLVRFVAQFLLPLVIFANLFALVFLIARPGGSGAEEFLSFSSVGDKQLGTKEKSRANFSSVAGADQALVELAEVRDYLVDPESFTRLGALPPKGVLLTGPPGCGKTLLARAVAGEAQANFYSISGSNFVESLVGVGAARVRDLFLQARANTPSIIFIDELDAVGRQRGAGLGGGHDEREQTLNEMLVQMDGFSPTEGVAVLAASNRPDILDPALLRPGRFDRTITVERPDNQGRLAILRLHATGKQLADPDTDLPAVARDTPGFTGADLANQLNEAALLARREHSDAIYRTHLDEAIERVVAGPQRKGTLIPPEEKRRIAYHEAGHAVVAAALGKTATIHKLSVVARGRGIGHLGIGTEDKNLLTTQDMEHRIAIAMAGLAAEELALGQPSTGSELDLERATTTARDMAGRYGMSPNVGRAQVLKQQGEIFLGRDYMAGQEISQPTLELLDSEVRRILETQEQIARTILTTNSDTLHNLVKALATNETLQGEQLTTPLSRIRPHDRGHALTHQVEGTDSPAASSEPDQ